MSARGQGWNPAPTENILSVIGGKEKGFLYENERFALIRKTL